MRLNRQKQDRVTKVNPSLRTDEDQGYPTGIWELNFAGGQDTAAQGHPSSTWFGYHFCGSKFDDPDDHVVLQ